MVQWFSLDEDLKSSEKSQAGGNRLSPVPPTVTIKESLVESAAPSNQPLTPLYGQYILDRKLVRRRRRSMKVALSNCVGRQAAGCGLVGVLESSRLRRYVFEPYKTPTEGSGKLAWAWPLLSKEIAVRN
jgi:hypothetical protein